MKNRKKKWICIGVALLSALVITFGTAEGKVQELQRGVAAEVFRFHVLANSDSDQDQFLKMQVKENVISYMKKHLTNAHDAQETMLWSEMHLPKIENVARQTIRNEGGTESVEAEVVQCYFPDKSYGDVFFPRGEYDALRVKIGKAKGKNWWCVLYPNLCFIDSVHAVVPDEGKETLKEVLEEEEYEMVTAMSKFKIKWFFFAK